MLLSQRSVRFCDCQDLVTACSCREKKIMSVPNLSVARQTKKQFYSLGRFPGFRGATDGLDIPNAVLFNIAKCKASICTTVLYEDRLAFPFSMLSRQLINKLIK